MGIAFSRKYNHRQHQSPTASLPPPTPPPSTSASPPVQAFTPQLPPPPPSSIPDTYAFASSTPYSVPPPPPPPPHQQRPYVPPYPPPLPPHNYVYNYSTWQPINYQYPSYRPYHAPQINGWSSSNFRPPLTLPAPIQPVPYVDHQSAKKVKNDVNVHKDTIRLQLDELNQDCHLVSFTFDALVDGSITVLYFAKEGNNCTFTPIYPEIAPVKVPFQKGLGQKFLQQSGTGVDLGFFDTNDLSEPIRGEHAYPLVILAESSHKPPTSSFVLNEKPIVDLSRRAQISQAVLEKKDGVDFQVKVIKQILWIDGVRYELREIFGINSSDESSTNNGSGKECIICLTEVKNTMVMPCRHLCMCSECAKELRLQTNKCPVCRQPIDELVEIKVDDEE